MKTTLFSFFALFFVVVSCKKEYDCFNSYDKECEICTGTAFEDPFATYPDNIKQYILDPLERDPATGYITKGSVKYVKDQGLVIMVSYGEDMLDMCGDKDGDNTNTKDWAKWGAKEYIYKEGTKRNKYCKFQQKIITTNTAASTPTNQ